MFYELCFSHEISAKVQLEAFAECQCLLIKFGRLFTGYRICFKFMEMQTNRTRINKIVAFAVANQIHAHSMFSLIHLQYEQR